MKSMGKGKKKLKRDEFTVYSFQCKECGRQLGEIIVVLKYATHATISGTAGVDIVCEKCEITL